MYVVRKYEKAFIIADNAICQYTDLVSPSPDISSRCFSLDKIVDFIKYGAVILSDNHIGKD
jgi:hypothetical protein